MPDDLRWMLLLDTCGSNGGVAIADLQQESAAIAVERELPGRETQERLMTAMAEVLAEASLTISDLSVIAVVTGPGSFTGTRIGLAAAKGLAEAQSLPVVAISRLAMLAAQAPTDKDTTAVQAWIDAGRGDVFVGTYQNGVCLGESMKHGADAVAEISQGETVVATEERVAALAPAVILMQPVTVRAALPLAVEKVQAGDFSEIGLLDANYLRVPDAELARLAAEARR